MKNLAIFDFDGTITKKDTFNELIKFHCGSFHFYFGMLQNILIIILYLCKRVSNAQMKAHLFNYFLGDLSKQEYNKLCSDFSSVVLPNLIRKDIYQIIQDYLKKNFKIVILSASFIDWIKPWAYNNGITDIICTKYHRTSHEIYIDEKESCYGKNKLVMLEKKFPNYRSYKIYAYGDSKSDYYFMNVANRAYFVKNGVKEWIKK